MKKFERNRPIFFDYLPHLLMKCFCGKVANEMRTFFSFFYRNNWPPALRACHCLLVFLCGSLSASVYLMVYHQQGIAGPYRDWIAVRAAKWRKTYKLAMVDDGQFIR